MIAIRRCPAFSRWVTASRADPLLSTVTESAAGSYEARSICTVGLAGDKAAEVRGTPNITWGHDEPVYTFFEQELYRVFFALKVLVAVGQDDAEPACSCDVADASEDSGIEGVVDVGGHYSYGVALAGHQAAGKRVGFVAEFPGCSLYLCRDVIAGVAIVAENAPAVAVLTPASAATWVMVILGEAGIGIFPWLVFGVRAAEVLVPNAGQ